MIKQRESLAGSWGFFSSQTTAIWSSTKSCLTKYQWKHRLTIENNPWEKVGITILITKILNLKHTVTVSTILFLATSNNKTGAPQSQRATFPRLCPLISPLASRLLRWMTLRSRWRWWGRPCWDFSSEFQHSQATHPVQQWVEKRGNFLSRYFVGSAGSRPGSTWKSSPPVKWYKECFWLISTWTKKSPPGQKLSTWTKKYPPGPKNIHLDQKISTWTSLFSISLSLSFSLVCTPRLLLLAIEEIHNNHHLKNWNQCNAGCLGICEEMEQLAGSS